MPRCEHKCEKLYAKMWTQVCEIVIAKMWTVNTSMRTVVRQDVNTSVWIVSPRCEQKCVNCLRQDVNTSVWNCRPSWEHACGNCTQRCEHWCVNCRPSNIWTQVCALIVFYWLDINLSYYSANIFENGSRFRMVTINVDLEPEAFNKQFEINQYNTIYTMFYNLKKANQ